MPAAENRRDDPGAAARAAADLAGQIEARWRSGMEKAARVTPVASNRASMLDDPCERRLYLWRTAWEQAAPPDATLQSIFSEGHLHEGAVVRWLGEAGIRLYQEQAAFAWKQPNITGHIEGEVVWRDPETGAEVPVLGEIKSCSPHAWARIRTAQDLREARGWLGYARRWYGQVQVYMVGRGYWSCVLIAKNKLTGELRAIPIPLDLDYAESLARKAERVEAAVAAGAVPPYTEDAEECRRCAFFGRACNPPTAAGQGAEVVVAEVEAARIWQETRAAASAHDAADKTLRAALRGRPLALVGDLICETKPYQTTVYEVPEGVRLAHARKVERERMTVRPLAPASGAEDGV